jgi:hypothetical protein
MALDYLVEIRGVLPEAVRQELRGRFGAITVDRRGDRTIPPACMPTKPRCQRYCACSEMSEASSASSRPSTQARRKRHD